MITEANNLFRVFTEHVNALFTAKIGAMDRTIHAAIGISGEAGEVIDNVKKAWVYGRPLDEENILEEGGDILFYLTALLKESGHTLEDAMYHNMAKLAKRYPQGWSPEAAIARADKV